MLVDGGALAQEQTHQDHSGQRRGRAEPADPPAVDQVQDVLLVVAVLGLGHPPIVAAGYDNDRSAARCSHMAPIA